MSYLHSSVIHGSTAHSNNPGVLYRTPHCTVDINSIGFKHCNAMHAYKPESHRVPQEYTWQLAAKS